MRGLPTGRLAMEDVRGVEKMAEIFPRVQCGKCGYPGWRPYAEAISCNGEKINRCAPGG
ncbi:(Fe-S)-binding protein, partial [Escherichia coli]|uniref:(Fe-S)-binding protein n=1 Tax=Escherichia coli TaxID=562 RepID=UPI0025A2E811